MTKAKTGVVKAYLDGVEIGTLQLPPGIVVDNDEHLREDVIALINESHAEKGKKQFDVATLRKNMRVLICYF